MKKILFMLVVVLFSSGIIVASEVPENIVFVGDSIIPELKSTTTSINKIFFIKFLPFLYFKI